MIKATGRQRVLALTAGSATIVAVFLTPPPRVLAQATSSTQSAASTSQYALADSDGNTWQEMDPSKLSVAASTSLTETSVLLTANADLFTASAGYNQDLGIFVSANRGADQLVGWKESGGSAGIYSPDPVLVQAAYSLVASSTYVFKLKWKTNRKAPGTTIYAGAGSPGNYSPTTLLVQTIPSGFNLAVSTSQYTLNNSDGASFQTMDATNLATTLGPSSVDETVILGANADLWTANAGYNQDLGIFVSDNGGAATLVAWKESGGFGIFSPNATFVKATYPIKAGHTCKVTLQWKTNRNAPGSTIYAGAGPDASSPAVSFSPTTLVAQAIPLGTNPYGRVSTSTSSLADSDGTTWQPMFAGYYSIDLSVSPAASSNAIVSANADLFTANAGYNQDMGIFVSDNGGADTLLVWKESGGVAGTYSPHPVFAQVAYPMTTGHTYIFRLKWKANKSASGTTIYAGAGEYAGQFSPTRISVELTN